MTPLLVTTFDDSSFARRKTCKRGTVLCARTHQRREAFHRFHVVVVDIRASVENNLDAPILGVKIRNEHFDNHRRIHLSDRRDCMGEMLGPAVLPIVARDGRDHDMF